MGDNEYYIAGQSGLQLGFLNLLAMMQRIYQIERRSEKKKKKKRGRDKEWTKEDENNLRQKAGLQLQQTNLT